MPAPGLVRFLNRRVALGVGEKPPRWFAAGASVFTFRLQAIGDFLARESDLTRSLGGTVTEGPPVLLEQQVVLLSRQLPAVTNGDAEAVHDARIATRRIRELLPLTIEWRRRGTVDDLSKAFRRVGRALGSVRDADVRVQLLTHLESRIPTAAPSLVVVRQRQEKSRLRLIRRLIKQLEHDDVAALLRNALAFKRMGSGWWHGHMRGWRGLLRQRIAERAALTGESVRHATGVYFPNRAHSARIAIKKLRYALEIAEATGGRNGESIRTLKKTQEILGELHDREELLNELSAPPSDDDPQKHEQIAVVAQVLEAETRDLHMRYLARREGILRIADALPHENGRTTNTPLIVAVSAIAASSGLLAFNRQRLIGR
jgi:CHAD domain-containing protein